MSFPSPSLTETPMPLSRTSLRSSFGTDQMTLQTRGGGAGDDAASGDGGGGGAISGVADKAEQPTKDSSSSSAAASTGDQQSRRPSEQPLPDPAPVPQTTTTSPTTPSKSNKSAMLNQPLQRQKQVKSFVRTNLLHRISSSDGNSLWHEREEDHGGLDTK